MISLRELQLCQLDIALEIKQICEKNNIPYFLIGGTLLGAVRHQGFIPWDDDLDIGFLRRDYDRFIEACKKDLGDDFFLQTFETDENYGLPFGKVMLKGTKFQEAVASQSGAKDMIFVDIFPYDNLPTSSILIKWNFIIQDLAKKLLQYRVGYDMSQRSSHKVLHKFLKKISKLFSKEVLIQTIEKAQKKYNNISSTVVINYNGAYRDKERVNLTEGYTVLPFEGYEFNVPSAWKELLTNMYGNYMQLPPVEKRGNRHAAIEADMGEYVIKNHMAKESNV